LYTLEQLKNDKEIWKNLEIIPAKCTWCNSDFEVKYGTLYNVIRRNAEGVYCSRKCAGSGRASYTQKKYNCEGGKSCKRCGEFKTLDNFSKLPNPPYFRAECRRCHNYKPARSYAIYKEKAQKEKVPFSIELEEFDSFWNKDCFYCSSKVKKIRLELINISGGYNIDNLVSCCIDCQKFKGNLTHLQFITMCIKVSENIKRGDK
jgi:hypothetical protein